MITTNRLLTLEPTRSRWLTALLRLAFLACIGYACHGTAFAQDLPQLPQTESQKNVGPHFFVPLDQLQTLIQQDHKWILLTSEEFKQLQADAARSAKQPQPPAAIGVQNVKYTGRVDDDQLVLTATMQITKFAPGWQMLPLEFTELSLEKATLDNQPAQLGRDPEAGGRLTLLLNQPGKHTLTLELSRSLVAVGSDKVAIFGLPRHTGVELTLDLAAQKHLQWNGLAVDRPAPNDQPAQFKLAVGGQKQVELKITDRPTQQTSEGLVFAQTAIGVRAAPEEVTWQAIASLQVFGKPLDQIQFRVPETLQIVSITSPGLESWEFGPKGPENGETLLNLRYRQPFQEPRDVTIQAVMAAKTSEGWLVPGLKLANVASHTVDVIVTTAPGMRLQVEEAVGVQRTAAGESKTPLVPGAMRFTAWREDFVLRFITQAKAREISAAIVTLLDINSNGLNLKSNVTVETRFAPLFEVLMTLPAEWTVTDALVNQERVTWETVPQEPGIHQLRIPFKNQLLPGQHAVIQLEAHRDPEGWPIETGKIAISLPDVRLAQSNVVEGTVIVAAETDLDLEAEQLKGLSPTLLDNSVAARLAYEYQDTHYSGQIQVSRKPSRIAARTLAFHRLDKETLMSHLEARLEIQGGGTRQLKLSLPESAGTNLRFELTECGSRIVEQTVGEPVKGRRDWTLLLDQRTRGNLLIWVDISQPRQKAVEFIPPTLQVMNAERETGSIAFEGESDQQLDLTAKDSKERALKDVDPADLPFPTAYVPKERIVAAFGYVLPNYQVKLTERRFERVAVPTAICDQLNLVSILGETGEFQHEATFRLRAVGVQSLQIQLPEGALLWATLLDDHPIEVRHTEAAYLIPLAASGTAEVPVTDDASRTRTLRLFYRTDAGVLAAAGRLTQTPPSITVLNGDGTVQPLEILQQEWVVHHPVQTEFISSVGQFQSENINPTSSFLGGLLTQFGVDSPSKLLWKLIAILIVVGAVWMIRAVVTHSGYRGLVGLTFLLGTGFIIFGLANFKAEKKSVDTYYTTAEKSRAPASPAIAPTNRYLATSGTEPAFELPTAPEGTPAKTMPQSLDNVEQLQEETISTKTANDNKPAQSFGDFLPPMADGTRFSGARNPPARNLPQRHGYSKLGTIAGMERRDTVNKEGGARTGRRPPGLLNSPPAEGKRDSVRAMAQTSEAKDAESQTEATKSEPAPADEKPAAPPPVAEPAGQAPNVPPPAVKMPVPAPDPQAMPAANEGEIDNVRPNAPPNDLFGGTKAIYSLALNLEIPEDSKQTKYAYRGRVGNTPAELVITYQNRTRLSVVLLVLQTFIALLFWSIRNRTLAFRVLCGAIGFAIPLALLTIVPANWLPILDGIFAGTFWGCCVLVIYTIGRWLSVKELSVANIWRVLNTQISAPLGILMALSFGVGISGPFGPELQAQQQSAQPNAAGPTAVPDAPANSLPKDAIGRGPSGTIIVPLTVDLDPDKAERVFLPYDKFLELWKQGHPDEQAHELNGVPSANKAPLAGVITDALFAAELLPVKVGVKPAVKVTGRFVCYSFREGQVALALPVGKVAVMSAKLDGETAPLIIGTEAHPLAILISKPGTHVVDLEFSVPAELAGPSGKFTLQLGAMPTGLLRFAAPASDLTYRVNGGSGAFRKTKVGDNQFLLVPVSAGGEVLISWRPQQSRGDVEAIVHVDSTTGLLLMDDGTRLLSDWNFQVRQGSLSEILFSLPPVVGVRKIDGADVGGWEVAGEGAKRQLKIFLRRKVENATQIKFDLFVKQKTDDLETSYEVPAFAPLNVTRETGTLAILADKQFGIRVATISGLSQIEPQLVPLQRLGDAFSGANVLSYRFANRPFQLGIVATRRQPQLKVQARHHAHLDSRRIQLRSQYQFNMLGAPRSSLAILLPQGYLLQDVEAADASDWHVSGREDSAQMDAEAQLYLEFPTPRTGLVEVTLIGKTLRQPEVMKAVISLPYPLEVDELDTQLLTTLDPIYSAQVGALDNWKSIDANALSQQLLGREATSGQFGFSTNTPAPAEIPLDLQQQVPQLSANVMTLLTVEEESLDYLFAMQWKIDSAGANVFVFTTPKSLAGKLDFPEGNGPRRRSVTQEDTADGHTRWTITLEDPQREQYFLIARTVLRPSDTGVIDAPNFTFEQKLSGQEPPQIDPLETQSQYVVLVNQSQTQLTSAAPDNMETIPADDLLQIIKLRPDLIHQAAEIIRVTDPKKLVAWKQERFQAEAMLPASVNLAHHVTVLAADGSWREQVNYRLRNRTRQFLAVRLPVDSQVLSLFVKGRAARPVQSASDASVTLIPLPKTTEGDVSFEVQLVLAGQLASGPLPRNWALFRRQLEIPVPAIIAPEENQEYGIPVSQSTWTVYAPQDLDVDLIKYPDSTNVHAVTETLQSYDQTSALLSDVSELISVNSSTYNRRAKAQSLNNLKQLNVKLLEAGKSKSSGTSNSAEQAKQQEIEQRVSQLQESINKVVISNTAEGLTITNDSQGNGIVVDQRAGQGGQSFRFRELYEDNGGRAANPADPFADDFATANEAPGKPNSGKAVTEQAQSKTPADGKKGNLRRGELRGLNYSQAQELSNEQQKKGGQQPNQAEPQERFGNANRSYFFQNDSGQPTGQLSGQKRVETAATGAVNFGFQGGQVIEGGPGQAPGGMGGGFGRPVGGPQGAPAVKFNENAGMNAAGEFDAAWMDNQLAAPVWSSTSGLSLLIEIPQNGQKLSFSKIGGDPRLALGVRPHQTLQLGLGLLWTIVWGVILLLMVGTLCRPRAAEFLMRMAPWFIAGLGMVVFFMVPTQAIWGSWGLIAFIIAALWIAFRNPRSAAI